MTSNINFKIQIMEYVRATSVASLAALAILFTAFAPTPPEEEVDKSVIVIQGFKFISITNKIESDTSNTRVELPKVEVGKVVNDLTEYWADYLPYLLAFAILAVALFILYQATMLIVTLIQKKRVKPVKVHKI